MLFGGHDPSSNLVRKLLVPQHVNKAFAFVAAWVVHESPADGRAIQLTQSGMDMSESRQMDIAPPMASSNARQ
jgi:hypothetical protein